MFSDKIIEIYLVYYLKSGSKTNLQCNKFYKYKYFYRIYEWTNYKYSIFIPQKCVSG